MYIWSIHACMGLLASRLDRGPGRAPGGPARQRFWTPRSRDLAVALVHTVRPHTGSAGHVSSPCAQRADEGDARGGGRTCGSKAGWVPGDQATAWRAPVCAFEHDVVSWSGLCESGPKSKESE